MGGHSDELDLPRMRWAQGRLRDGGDLRIELCEYCTLWCVPAICSGLSSFIRRCWVRKLLRKSDYAGGRFTNAFVGKHGATVIAFVEDPDGYKIELIKKKSP